MTEKSLLIEKNIAFSSDSRSKELRQTLEKMEIGDSFLLPADKQALAHNKAFKLGIGIKTRKQPCGNIRVWRIEKKNKK